MDGYDAEPWNGYRYDILHDPSVCARCCRSEALLTQPTRCLMNNSAHHVTEIAKHQTYAPFGFMTNGQDTWFWEVGQANPRLVAGFFAAADLKRLLFLRLDGQPLAATPINTSIVDRPYQHEAIRRVAEAFEAKRRRALLVMATGTGKTRTDDGIHIDLFLRDSKPKTFFFLRIVMTLLRLTRH